MLFLTVMKTLKSRLTLKHIAKLLCGASFLWAFSAPAQDVLNVGPTDSNNISSADRIARTLIETLPDSGTKNGLLRYYQILNPQAYTSDNDVAINNTGVAHFFEYHFKNNACFAEKALRFYHDVRSTTKISQKTNPEEKRNSRPSLGDKSGNTRKDLPEGWLYNKALKYANGNPNLALTLIGMCGHDDTKQGNFANSQVESKLANAGFNHEALFLASEDGAQDSPCPPLTSDFFISGSLGRKDDIEDALKKRILKVQYPGKTSLQIASKNYHVLGAAFMTCQMIEAGLSPFLAVRVESLAASLYRGIRLCQNIEVPASLFWKLQRHPEIRKRPASYRFEDAVMAKALEYGRNKTCLSQKYKDDALCELLQTVGAPFDLSIQRLEDRAKGLIEKYMDNMIASGLYAAWHVSGEIAGISLPCSRSQLFGPHPFMKWLVSQAEVPLNICGSGLSVESCRKALGTISSWEIDFDWTVSQHMAGAKFAASVCKPYPQGRSSMNESCN